MIYKYAKADGPPDCWRHLKVFDLDTGEEVSEVVEVNTDENWLIRYVMPQQIDPATDALKVERVEGRFEIRDMRD